MPKYNGYIYGLGLCYKKKKYIYGLGLVHAQSELSRLRLILHG